MATAATRQWMLRQNQPSTSQITGASVWNQRQVFFSCQASGFVGYALVRKFFWFKTSFMAHANVGLMHNSMKLGLYCVSQTIICLNRTLKIVQAAVHTFLEAATCGALSIL
jgi:hypothetical protein